MLDVSKFGTVMGVWAHPDDETYSMAGIMYACAQNGQQVVCVTATRGEAGVQDETKWPQARLAEIRSTELAEALQVLGVKNHHWLDYPDGGCAEIETNEAVGRIAELIEQYRPDTIFSFGRDGMTGHSDHITVSNWATMAAQKAGSKARVHHAVLTPEQHQAMLVADEHLNIFFNTHEPPVLAEDDCAVCFVLPEDVFSHKLRALRAMPSQTTGMLEMFSHVLPQAVGIEAFRCIK